MSVESHLAELKKRHSELNRQIDDAKLHPSFDDLEMATLKRQKLMLKDEMERLKTEAELH